jgi:hypothetical protein
MRAASKQNKEDRVGDVGAVLDALTAWQTETGHPLVGRLDLERVGMSGRSFGARTMRAVAGQAGTTQRQPGPGSQPQVTGTPLGSSDLIRCPQLMGRVAAS